MNHSGVSISPQRRSRPVAQDTRNQRPIPPSYGRRGPRPDSLLHPPADSGLVRFFLISFAILLGGYGILGRSFAYLGVAPLYVGEMVLGLGLVAMFKSGTFRVTLQSPISKLLIVFLLWSLVATVPYFPAYGMTTLRDAVLWGYAAYAIIVATVIIGSPDSMRWLLLRFRSYSMLFAASAWLVYVIYISHILEGFGLPGSPVDLFDAPGGQLLVQLAGVVAFVSVGMMKKRWAIVPFLLLNMAILMVSKRAGMLAVMGAFGLIVLLNPPKLKLAVLAYIGIFTVMAALIVNPTIDLGHGRVISMEQLTDNVVSTFDQSSSSSLETTKSWRLDWWTDIFNYTFGGQYFVFGKGYGINLATDDGYQVLDGEALRSPHNAHFNVLARSGVPGFFLWLAIHFTWFVSLLRACLQARRNNMPSWHGIFAFLLAFWLAFMINASFDVFLESPVGGIWLWSLMGFGMGALHLFKTSPAIGLDQTPTVITVDTYTHG